MAQQPKATQLSTGYILTGRCTACTLLRQLDDFLDEQDGEATGPEGYNQLFQQELQQKLPGYSIYLYPRKSTYERPDATHRGWPVRPTVLGRLPSMMMINQLSRLSKLCWKIPRLTILRNTESTGL